ncbi:hypothetical protein M9458_049860, partial [Cirrhinus mrigala]
MSAYAAGIPVISSPEDIRLSTALPVMAITILSVWAAHCTPEASSVHESAPESLFLHKFVPEASPVHKFFPDVSPAHGFAPVSPEVAAPAAEPPEDAASIAEPQEVPALAAESSKGVAPIQELTASPVTAMEAIHEFAARSVTVK